MIPGVVADGMPGLGNLPYDIGMFFCVLANHEKGRVRLMSRQNVEKTRRPPRVWAIIECEGSDRASGPDVGYRPHQVHSALGK
jgi:hypothetical protein